jgi:phosphatidylcholine synthase
LFFWQMTNTTNLGILLLLAILSFVPIKYVYPSRLEYLSNNKVLRVGMMLMTIVWGMATMGLLWVYPQSNRLLVSVSMSYIVLYIVISLYRTWVPLSTLVPEQE